MTLDTETLLRVLDRMLVNKSVYQQQQRQRIDSIRLRAEDIHLSPREKLRTLLRLESLYAKHNIDTAFYYAYAAERLAEQLSDDSARSDVRIRIVRLNGREVPYARFPKAGEWGYDGYKLSPIIHIPSVACDAPIEIEIVVDEKHLVRAAELYGKQKWFERCVSLTEEFKFACGQFDTWMMLPVEYLRVAQTPNRITECPAQIVEYLDEFAAQIEPMHRRIATFDRLDDRFKQRVKAQLH